MTIHRQRRWSYYNDNDPFVCEWARNLIKAGLVPDGEVDERPIQEVTSEDVKGFVQVHFFCGILGWPLALKLAGWPEDREVYSGSCPCQPFSIAGKRQGTSDKRHLWPEFLRLISKCLPPTIFGEQVASKDGKVWLAGVRSDLEELGYAVGAADLCAAGVGAPHIRQRLWWVAQSDGGNSSNRDLQRSVEYGQQQEDGEFSRVANHAGGVGLPIRQRDANPKCGPTPQTSGRVQGAPEERERVRLDSREPDDPLGFWSSYSLIPCLDGKFRRVPKIESGVQPLSYGVPARVGRLRAYGNAIVPQVAAEVIFAFLDAESHKRELRERLRRIESGR